MKGEKPIVPRKTKKYRFLKIVSYLKFREYYILIFSKNYFLFYMYTAMKSNKSSEPIVMMSNHNTH